MGILFNHIPILTGLDIGAILIRNESSQQYLSIIVSGGFALVNNNIVTILVNEAEIFSNTDSQELEKIFLEKKIELDSVSDQKKKLELSIQLKKIRAKLLVSQQFIN